MRKKIVLRLIIFLTVLLLAGAVSYAVYRSPRVAPLVAANITPGLVTDKSASSSPTIEMNQTRPPMPHVDTPFPAAGTPAGSGTANPTPVQPGATQATSPAPFKELGIIRAVRADYKDMAASRDQVIPLEQAIREAGFNLVSLGAGRAEWTYFKWAGHVDGWSSDVKTTGVDFLADDSSRFGAWARVDAAVDVLSPLYIQKNPSAAAISADGIPSLNLISTMQMVEGPYGRQLLEMIEAIAANYPVDSISINELAYHRDGYGADDKTAYLAYTKQADWPRLSNGSINIDDPSLAAWRSYELGRFLQQARAAAHRYGKELFVNTTLTINGSGQSIQPNLAVISAMLNDADWVIIWNNLNLAKTDPKVLAVIATSLAPIKQSPLVFVLGLWGLTDDRAVTPVQLQDAMQAVQSNGLKNLWITPASLMDPVLWQTVSQNWSP